MYDENLALTTASRTWKYGYTFNIAELVEPFSIPPLPTFRLLAACTRYVVFPGESLKSCIPIRSVDIVRMVITAFVIEALIFNSKGVHGI